MPETASKFPFFTVITVTLNNLDGLKRTAASLDEQDMRDFEWIVIDGSSTDGTREFLAATTALWSSEADEGLYDAMNRGLERGNGHYVLFLNAGDTLVFPETLSEIKAAAGPSTPDFIYGDSLEAATDETPQYKAARNHESRAWGMFTHHQAMLYRRDKIGELRYDPAYKIAADYDFTLHFLHKNPSALYCRTPVCLFESGGISQQNARAGRAEQYEIRKKLGTCSPAVNLCIFGFQRLSWSFRTLAPGLYWRLRD